TDRRAAPEADVRGPPRPRGLSAGVVVVEPGARPGAAPLEVDAVPDPGRHLGGVATRDLLDDRGPRIPEARSRRRAHELGLPDRTGEADPRELRLEAVDQREAPVLRGEGAAIVV